MALPVLEATIAEFDDRKAQLLPLAFANLLFLIQLGQFPKVKLPVVYK